MTAGAGLPSVLAEAGIGRGDHRSIDTEGAEGLVPDFLDFGRVAVTVFSIGNNRADPALRARMDGLGHDVVVRLGMDDLFRRRGGVVPVGWGGPSGAADGVAGSKGSACVVVCRRPSS